MYDNQNNNERRDQVQSIPVTPASDEYNTTVTTRDGDNREPVNPSDVKTGAQIGGVGGAVTGAVAGAALGPVGAVGGAIIGGIGAAVASAAAVHAVDQVDGDYDGNRDGIVDRTGETYDNRDVVGHTAPSDRGVLPDSDRTQTQYVNADVPGRRSAIDADLDVHRDRTDDMSSAVVTDVDANRRDDPIR